MKLRIPPLTRKRPATLLVMAIFNFLVAKLTVLRVLGCGMGVLCIGPVGSINQPGQKQVLHGCRLSMGDPAQETEKLLESIPGYLPYLVFSEVMELVTASLLVIAGVGLLMVKPWARVACIGYAIYTILASIGGLIYVIAVVNPALRQMYGSMGSQPATVGKSDLVALAWFGQVAVYAIVLLVVMYLPHVRAAFVREPPVRVPDLNRWTQKGK